MALPSIMSMPPKPLPILDYRARLSDRKQLNERFIELDLELIEPNRIEFRAGQYIMVKVPGIPHTRSYSISSAPQVNHAVELLIDLQPQGPGTKYLDSLQLGQEIEFKAPVGIFTVPGPDTDLGREENQLIFLATGSGIAPYKGIAEDLLLDKRDERLITLVWGLRHEIDQFWYEELQLLAQEHQNFSFQPVLSQPQGEWAFHKGHITDVLQIQEEFSQTGFYLCGNNAMILEGRQILAEKGVDPRHIHSESFH